MRYRRLEVRGREEALESLTEDWRKAELSERERALCAYTEKLTLEPSRMEASDLEPLRRIGLDDLGILHLAHVIGFFAYANRIVDGLGCEGEAGAAAEHG